MTPLSVKAKNITAKIIVGIIRIIVIFLNISANEVEAESYCTSTTFISLLFTIPSSDVTTLYPLSSSKTIVSTLSPYFSVETLNFRYTSEISSSERIEILYVSGSIFTDILLSDSLVLR